MFFLGLRFWLNNKWSRGSSNLATWLLNLVLVKVSWFSLSWCGDIRGEGLGHCLRESNATVSRRAWRYPLSKPGSRDTTMQHLQVLLMERWTAKLCVETHKSTESLNDDTQLDSKCHPCTSFFSSGNSYFFKGTHISTWSYGISMCCSSIKAAHLIKPKFYSEGEMHLLIIIYMILSMLCDNKLSHNPTESMYCQKFTHVCNSVFMIFIFTPLK